MVRMINALMGNDMYVPENRVEEYLAAGHKLAAVPVEKKEDKTPVKKNNRKRKE